MSTDDRQLVVVDCMHGITGGEWELQPKSNERVGSGLYLMIPIDDLEQSAQIVIDIAQGMRIRTKFAATSS
jgi:hypothetical protein